MQRIIKSMEEKYLLPSLTLVEQVFTDHENEKEGKLVRRLVEEIRSKKYYVPELELIMVNEEEEVIGYVMFSRFHIEGKYENELLLLAPAAVRTDSGSIATTIRTAIRSASVFFITFLLLV